jgi:RNA polymerase sigma factor (sigma-70 family)
MQEVIPMDHDRLVHSARAGDADAFTELVRRYQAMAFGYAYARVGDFHLAEDIAQQAFLAAWRSLPTLNDPARFGGWLKRIVQFESAHLLRGRQAPELPIDDARLATAGDDPPRAAERQEGFDRALAAINRLPGPEREVTILFYIHDHSQRQVAAFLNLPVTTVNNRLRSARALLRQGDILTMANDALNDNRLPDSFATRVGEIVRAQGRVIDARFPAGQRPRVLNALTVTDDSAGPAITVDAIQHLDDDLVRCIALTSDAFPLETGLRVTDTGGPIGIPLTDAAIRQVMASLRVTTPATETVATGIKAIDLLAPLPRRGRVALVGDMQTGKMVLVEELIRRLADDACELSILVFVETSKEVAAIQELDYRTSANVEAVYLPVADARAEALAAVTAEIDAVVSLSRRLAQQRLYPAIDPAASTSRLLDPAIVGAERVAVASRVRELLASGSDDVTALRLRAYLTQPFHVAEEFTGRPGQDVPPADTVRDCRALLAGADPALDADALYMTGALPDTRA